jgi:hypothetical protein
MGGPGTSSLFITVQTGARSFENSSNSSPTRNSLVIESGIDMGESPVSESRPPKEENELSFTHGQALWQRAIRLLKMHYCTACHVTLDYYFSHCHAAYQVKFETDCRKSLPMSMGSKLILINDAKVNKIF